MDKMATANALDSAIANVANRERLRLGKDSNAIQNAFEELDKLQTNDMPQYNEWVALFYLLWYQPRQINLAYSMAKNLLKYRRDGKILRTDGGNLHLIDLGCGVMAMQCGLALALTEVLEQGHEVGSVHVHAIDQSRAMVDLGEALWMEFEKRVANNGRLAGLGNTIKRIKWRTYTVENPPVLRSGSEDIWLTALHAVYVNNIDSLQEALMNYKTKLNPDVCFITSHNFKRDLVAKASPFKGDSNYSLLRNNLEPEFTGQLPRVIGHRKGPLYSGLWGRARNYLNQPVQWEWGPTSILAYDKR